jgi:hypothetical protein
LIPVVAGSVMEGASVMFHEGYKKRYLLTIVVSQILLLIKVISEIKYLLLPNGLEEAAQGHEPFVP